MAPIEYSSTLEVVLDTKMEPGDVVVGNTGWQDYAVAKARDLHKLDPSAAPITTALGVLGHIGLTAYFGLIDICHPIDGETVVVSGAAGAVDVVCFFS